MRTQVFFLTVLMLMVSVLVALTGCTGRMVPESPVEQATGPQAGGEQVNPCDTMSLQGYKTSGTVQGGHTVYCF